jgi:hypothetical protein
MAAANAWGLLLLTLMLGYGLVEFPRSLWYSASTRWSLTDCEMSAPRLREAMIDADTEVYDVTRVIFYGLMNRTLALSPKRWPVMIL